MSNISDELLKAIKYAVDKKTINCDRTYKSVVLRVTPKGCIVLDKCGNERTVQCCIPGAVLKAGQKVWIKEPQGDLKGLHICGLI